MRSVSSSSTILKHIHTLSTSQSRNILHNYQYLYPYTSYLGSRTYTTTSSHNSLLSSSSSTSSTSAHSCSSCSCCNHHTSSHRSFHTSSTLQAPTPRRDYYEVLGVSKGATKDEIKKSYYSLVKK